MRCSASAAKRCAADRGPPQTGTVPGLQRNTIARERRAYTPLRCCAAPGTRGRTNLRLQEPIAASGSLFPACYLQGTAQLQRVGPSTGARGRTTMRLQRQDLFLRSRISANTFHAGLPASPTDLATSGTSARRNGFAAFSVPMVDGMVGSRAARSLSTSVARARNAALSGSTVLAKATLALVYSWPQ